MGIYQRWILPHVLDLACGSKPVRYQRQKVVPLAEGLVLEVGIGSGLNLPFYDAARINRVIGLDPSGELRAMAKKRAEELSFDVEFIGLPGEEIPLENDSVDTVMLTYTLCTIPEPEKALDQMRRVLKPGGRLVFCEHGRAPDENVRRWQSRITPLWRRIAGGCHLNRNIPNLIEGNGFKAESMETMYLPSTPRFAGFNYWGVAMAR
ncbi:MAG: class I SAM-dependent methyltransferase [Parvularculales bacterium]